MRGIVQRLALALVMVATLVGAVAGAALAQSDCRGMEMDSPGLLSDTEYEGPIFGNDVEWDDMWEPASMSNDFVAEVVGEFSQPIDCEGNTGDRLTLVHRLSPSAVLEIQTYQLGMWTFESMEADMEHPGWTANLGLEQGSDVLLSGSDDTSLAMLARDSADPAHLAYHEVYFPEGEDYIMSYTLHIWDEDALSPLLGDFEQSVDIDDMPVFAVFDADDVEEAAG
jgi:hypothetical protein